MLLVFGGLRLRRFPPQFLCCEDMSFGAREALSVSQDKWHLEAEAAAKGRPLGRSPADVPLLAHGRRPIVAERQPSAQCRRENTATREEDVPECCRRWWCSGRIGRPGTRATTITGGDAMTRCAGRRHAKPGRTAAAHATTARPGVGGSGRDRYSAAAAGRRIRPPRLGTVSEPRRSRTWRGYGRFLRVVRGARNSAAMQHSLPPGKAP